MAIELIGTIKPKNNGKFPMVEAEDVLIDQNGTRLPRALELLTPIYLTQDEYDALETAGTVQPDREYRIVEDGAYDGG